jgi:hypothetical protein
MVRVVISCCCQFDGGVVFVLVSGVLVVSLSVWWLNRFSCRSWLKREVELI